MTHDEIIRAWKDVEYRESLGEAERAQLGENPAGLLQLTDDDLHAVQGGWTPATLTITVRVCTPAIRASVRACEKAVQLSLKHCHKLTRGICTPL